MKTFKTHYFNAFEDEHGDYFVESKELTYEEAVMDILDTPYPYAYTMEIGLEDIKRIDLESVALEVEHGDENERVTGHEMGVLNGRV